MRKFVLVLVAALATSAMAAAPYVELVAGTNAGEVDVMYVSDGTDANLPSGFGLTISVSAGTISGISNLNAAYNIYPGQIVIVDGNVTDYNTPVAAEAGTGIGTNTVVLEFGALYERGVDTAPAATGRLCTITVDTTCTVTVAGDDARAGNGMGIVAQDYTAYPVSDTLGVTLATDCLSTSAPYYAKWVEYGKPDCWCFRKQCRGDADGLKTLTKPVMIPDLNIFKSAYNKTKAQVQAIANGICADFDKLDTLTKPVMIPDLNIFKANYNKADGSVLQCDGTYILEWKN